MAKCGDPAVELEEQPVVVDDGVDVTKLPSDTALAVDVPVDVRPSSAL